MDDVIRTPLEQLESEAIYLIRESAALFDNPALLVSPQRRSQALEKLAHHAFGPDRLPFDKTQSVDDRHDAYLLAETGENFEVWPLFGKPPKAGQAWSVFPLASWSDKDVDTFLSQDSAQESQRLLRLCVVGEPASGKSSLVRGLMAEAWADPKASTHRHLETAERRLFIIDPPGQDPYSHGLMAAASSSELALLVVDAQRGLTDTGTRQAFLLALMGVPHIVVVVNKMDSIDFDRGVYERIVADVQAMSAVVEIKNLTFVPTAALSLENLRDSSPRLSWHHGPSLLTHIDSITPGSTRNLTDLRLPVQRTHQAGQTRIAGRLASGRIKVGEQVVILPSGVQATVTDLARGVDRGDTAVAGDSVSLGLESSEVDLASAFEGGDMIVSPQSLPCRSSELEAVLLWLDDETQESATPYLLHHGTRLIRAHVSRVLAKLEPNSLSWSEGSKLEKGDIGRVQLTTAAPLYFDSYTANREMGAFALLHETSRAVLGAGVLRGPAQELPDVTGSAERLSSKLVVEDPTLVERRARRESYGHDAAVLWFTGLSGSGKSAVAKEVEKRLFERGCHTLFLDGDNVRSGLNGDLGFTEEARTESNRRVGELASLAFEQGQIVVCSFISGKQADREFVRSLLPAGHFFECFVNCPIEVCRSRDPKNLYEKADAGELLSFSGISIPYDEPTQPDLELCSDQHDVGTLADIVMQLLELKGVVGASSRLKDDSG